MTALEKYVDNVALMDEAQASPCQDCPFIDVCTPDDEPDEWFEDYCYKSPTYVYKEDTHV